jgi:hypothetical protein
MSYRNPRFSKIHTMRDVGDDGFDATTEGTFPFRSDTPRTRWLDEQAGPLAGKDDDFQRTEYARSTDPATGTLGGTMHELARWIIPATHNFGLDRTIELLISAEYPTTSYLPVTLSDGSIIARFCPSSGLIDLQLDTAVAQSLARSFQFTWWASNSGVLPNVGEVFWSDIVQPATGTDFGWEHDREAVDTDLEMEAGGIYTTVDGEPRRRFTLKHNAINGADLKLYEELRRYTLYNSRAFWFDHQDSGDVEAVLNPLTLTGQFDNLLGNGFSVEQVVVNGAPDGIADCVAMLTDGASGFPQAKLLQTSWDAAAPTDLRDFVLQFDLLFVTDATWVISSDSFFVDIVNQAGTLFSRYDVAAAMLGTGAAAADTWYRIQIDLEQDGRTNLSQLDPKDAYNVTFSIDGTANGSSRPFQLANVRVIDKAKQPVYVKIVPGTFQKPQESRAPGGSGGPRYNVEFDMIEVTT